MKVQHTLVVGTEGSITKYGCACGARGSYEAVLRHIAEHEQPEPDLEPSLRSQGFPQGVASKIARRDPDDAVVRTSVPTDDDDFGGGNTKAHYLPNEPKTPAPPAASFADPDPTPPSTPRSRGAPRSSTEGACPICAQGDPVHDLPEISTWSCGHGILKHPRSIAESFQDMLRIAYQAGAASAATGEIFETWYQREVLQ